MQIQTIAKIRDNLLSQNEISLFPYQKEISDAILDSVINNKGNEIVIQQARQSGKSEVVADTALFLLLMCPIGLAKPIRIGIFAPKEGLAQIIFNRIKERFPKNLSWSGHTIDYEISNGDTFKLSNGSMARCITASKDAKITGETFDVLILDECQDIDRRKIMKDISPMGAFTNATKIYIGTPAFHKSFYWEKVTSMQGKPNYFEVHWEEAARYNPKYKKYVDGEKIKIGEDTDEFQSQYCLKWILERGMFITQQQFEGLQKSIPPNEVTKYAGIDWGKLNDSTVVTVIDEDFNIIDWLELLGDNYADQLDYVIAFLDKHKVYRISCDASGTQDQIVDLLIHRVGDKVVGVKLTAVQQNDMWHATSQVMHENRLGIPSNINTREFRRFRMQMLDAEKEYKSGMLSVHSPDDNDEAHDDYVDSLALAVWCLLQYKRNKIEFGAITW